MAGNRIWPQKHAGFRDFGLPGNNVLPWHSGGRLSTKAGPAGESSSTDLDPKDWDEFARASHAALDSMIAHLKSIREHRVWSPPTSGARARFRKSLPRDPRALSEVLAEFDLAVKPYATGNLHPAFMGWVHGAGTPVGMIAEMLAAGLNMNCGGRNHIGIEIENQITRWMIEAFRFPATASGLFVTGTSMANFLGLIIARHAALGSNVRASGVAQMPRLCAYAAQGVHGCIARAMEMSGLGSDFLRLVPTDAEGAMRAGELEKLIAQDKARGFKPFLVVGTAGSVDIGAIDPLTHIADIAAAHGLWFHVDGAFGALSVFSAELGELTQGIERADSIGFDFHKWAHVPYDAGFLLVRDAETHRASFAAANAYLSRAESGLAAGETWPCDLGPDLSRGCRALKVWFTLQVYGADGLGQCMLQNCRAAKHLEAALRHSRRFVPMAPVKLNIVCFSAVSANPDDDNRRIVEALQLSGRAAPSLTWIDGRCVIRCAIVNHRTTIADIDVFVADLKHTATELGM